jgi:hypothetical protein
LLPIESLGSLLRGRSARELPGGAVIGRGQSGDLGAGGLAKQREREEDGHSPASRWGWIIRASLTTLEMIAVVSR